MPPAPRPATLEWHVDERPDAPAVLTADASISCRELEQRAGELAEQLVPDLPLPAGTLLSGSGDTRPWRLTLSSAAAKLGVGLVALPPGPAARDLDRRPRPRLTADGLLAVS